MRSKTFLLSFILWLTFAGAKAQTDPFADLIGVVLDGVTDYSEDIRESVMKPVTTDEVLSYLIDAYSEHGYRETGSWTYDEFIFPVRGQLTSGFGYRPKRKRFHHGIDIALNPGDTVRSALPGVVTKISYDKGGYGNYVVVSHNEGMETLYGHLSISIVKPGQKLLAGQPLGIGGRTGNSTGPHLHFEARYYGVARDPMSLFNLGNPVR